MKMSLIICAWWVVAAAASCLCFSAPVIETKPNNVKRNADAMAAVEAGDEAATYSGSMAEFRVDKQTLTDRQAAYDVDRIATTNAQAIADIKIALVADAATKLALQKCATTDNKLQNEIEDLNRCITSLKQMVVDLKKAVVAEKQGK